MKKKTIQKFQEMIDILYNEGSMSPARMSRLLHADTRTLKPMIQVAEKLKLITCERLTLSYKTYRKIDLTKDYRELLEHSKKSG